jgi:hypothetical protein
MTWLIWPTLLIAFTAFAYAWKLHQELNTATRRLDRYNKALYDASDEVRRLRAEVTATAAQLRVEIKRGGGHLTFDPAMTVREAQLFHPQAEQILAGFHLGGCSSCAVEPDETLAQVCAEHGQDVGQLIKNLNGLVTLSNGQPVLQPVKLPNVELNF